MFVAPLFSPTVATSQQVDSIHICGTVVDTDGALIEGANVSLIRDKRVVASTETNAEGKFECAIPGPGTLSIAVTSAGFRPTESILDPSTLSSVRVVLLPQSVAAEVTIAARTTTSLSETAASVVQLDSHELNTTAAITLDDALRQIAGFSLFRRSGSRTANPTSQGVSLRGTGASGASRALVLADGIPLNDPFGGWVYWDRVPRESISQIEVLLGGASHLYGSGALGGVIDVETKKPSTSTLSLSASYGNETTPNASLFASGTTNGWGGSLAAETFHTDGYILVPESQRGSVDTRAGTRDTVINLRGEKKVGEYLRLFGTTSFFGEARENGTPLQTNRTHLRQFGFGISAQAVEIGSVTARAYGGTQVYDQNFSAISTDRNSETLTRVQRVPAQVFGLSSQWSKLVGRHQTLVAGLEGREVRGASDEIAYVNGRATSFIGAGGKERTAGGYFEDLIQIGSSLFLNLGVREDHWRNFSGASASRPITAANPTNVTQFADRTENAFSPHGSLVYRFNDRVSLMAAMSRAFRAPTQNELYRSFRVGNVLTLANENLKAERLTGGEAGLRFGSATDKLSVRGNFFWNDITRPLANVTLTTTPALVTRQRQNLGSTRSLGVELEAETRLNRNWSVSSSYLFAHATVIEFPANTSLEGLWIPQVPRQQFTFQTRYEQRLITISLQGRASSSQFDDDQNQFRLNSYFTLDAYVSHKLTTRFEIFAAFENVFDQRYEVGKTPVTTLGPPILSRAGLRIQLGKR